MTTAYTSLLGLALPVTGELSGTWGDTVNNSITSLLDSAIAGTTTITADTTLSTTTGAANQSRQAILLCSPASANITITAPAQSKIYTVINTSATYTVKIVGVGPTTGVTLAVSESAVVAWNGSDFIRISSNSATTGNFTVNGNLSVTGNTTLGDATTDTVTINGYVGIGGAGNAARAVSISSSALTGVSQIGYDSRPVFSSAATTNGLGVFTAPRTAATAFTMTDAVGYYANDWTKGAGSTITNQHGIYIDNQTTGTNNYGITSAVTSGTNKWNIYASGTAQNYFAGNVLVGKSATGIATAGVELAESNVAGKVQMTRSAAPPLTLNRLTTDGLIVSLYKDGTAVGGMGSASGGIFLGSGTSGTTAVTIDTSQNVGIGVTPSAWLSTWRAIQNTGGALYSNSSNQRIGFNAYLDGTTTFKYIATGFATDYQQGAGNGSHIWWIAPSGTAGTNITFTQAMTLDASGRLLVGTTSATGAINKFTVGTGLTTSNAVAVVNTANTNVDGLMVSNWDGTTTSFGPRMVFSNSGRGSFYLGGSDGAYNFDIARTWGTPDLRIDTNGLVGIGTTTISQKLTVGAITDSANTTIINSSSTGRSALVVNSNTSSAAEFAVNFTGATDAYGLVTSAVGLHVLNANPLTFGTNATERMRIDSSGNVGIGTTSPSDKLNISGGQAIIQNTTTASYVDLKSTGGDFYVGLDNSAGSAFSTAAYAAMFVRTGAYPFIWRNNGSNNMTLDASGRLGIGTTSTGPKLEVAGGVLSTAYNFTTGGGINAANTGTLDTDGAGLVRFYSHGSNTSTTGSFAWRKTASDGTLDTQVMRIDAAGNVVIGTATPSAGQSLVVSKLITGAVTSYGVLNNGTIQQDVTSSGIGYATSLSSNAAAFTLNEIRHYDTTQATIGAGSVVSNQYAFIARSTLTGATTNYGFTGNLTAPTSGIATTGTITSISSSTTTVTVNHNAITYTNGQVVTISATANATALTSGATCTILTVGTTDFTLIGAASNTVGVSFTATGAGTGTGTVTLNVQGSGKTVAGAASGSFTYTTTTSQTFAAVTVLTGSVTVSTRYNLYMAGTADNYIAGNVGIGTSSPSGKLDISDTVNGQLKAQIRNLSSGSSAYSQWLLGNDTNSNAAGMTLNSSTNTASLGGASSLNIYQGLAAPIAFQTQGTERMRIDSSGNVGIGTSSPSERLTVNNTGGASTGGLRVFASDQGQARIRVQNTNGQAWDLVAGNPGATNQGFGIYDATTAATRLYIDTAGNVGIGVTPIANFGLLQVNTATNGTAAYLGFGAGVHAFNSTGYYSSAVTLSSAGIWTARSTASGIVSPTNSGTILFYTDTGLTSGNTFTPSERVRIDSSGNVGIGTSSPADLLTVNRSSGSGITSGISLTTAAGAVGDGSYVKWTGAGTSEKIARIDGVQEGTDLGSIRFNTGNGSDGFAERARIDSVGNMQMQAGAVMPYAPAPASISTTATLTNANIQAQIINTTGATYTVTMPLGTTLETLASWATTNIGYDFFVINTATGIITMAVNTGVTSLGLLTIAAATSAHFRIRRTAANTFVLYRLV